MKSSLWTREAAEIFGGRANAFSRYENGKTRPPVALVKLLRLLDRHPDLLAEVAAFNGECEKTWIHLLGLAYASPAPKDVRAFLARRSRAV